MSIFERSKIVFMGGSLIEHGGQNPLEPLSHGCFILSGSFNKNFEEIYLALERHPIFRSSLYYYKNCPKPTIIHTTYD